MCMCVLSMWVYSEVTEKGVMYFKKVNTSERCQHVPLVRKTAEGESRKGRRIRTLMGSDGCAIKEIERKSGAKRVKRGGREANKHV